jgi:hypothetical protein
MPALYRPLALLTVLLLVSCDNERTNKLEKQNQELLAEVKKDNAVADYDLQAKCAHDSKIWFNENWGHPEKDTLLLNYSNHYNKRLNKCFIIVEYHHSLFGLSWANNESVWDIYENSEYGSVIVTHMIYQNPEFREEESVGSCKVYGKDCKTLDEFDNLARPYLND